MTDTQAVISTPNERRYFSSIPHIADDDLNLHEYRLYGHYVKVCGMCRDICTESLREIAEKLGMGQTKLIESRESLQAKGYIYYVRIGKADAEVGKGETYAVAIADKWLENVQRYTELTSVPVQVRTAPNGERSDDDSAPIQKRTAPNEERTAPNGEQKDKEVKKEEITPPATPPAARAATRSGQRYGIRTLNVAIDDPVSPKKDGSGDRKSSLLADYLESTTGKQLTKAQRDRLAKKIVIPGDGMKSEYMSPDILYADVKSGFSHFVMGRLEAYKAKGEFDLKIIIGDICNYERNKQGGQPGWLAWKDKNLHLTTPPPTGSDAPLHQQRTVLNLDDRTGPEIDLSLIEDVPLPPRKAKTQ